jgi:Transposase and inactivated derivatives
MRIFLDAVDYRKFLYVLGDVVDSFAVECWDFCVMPNHYHLTVRPGKPNLSAAIAYLNSVYAQWWNRTHSKVGHVFQGRFKDQVVQQEGYLLTLCRYIALNPVRANLVGHPADWEWSSYNVIAGLRPDPGFLLVDPVLRQFGSGEVPLLRGQYATFVLNASPDEDCKAERLRSNERVLGDGGFKMSTVGERTPRGADEESDDQTSEAPAFVAGAWQRS